MQKVEPSINQAFISDNFKHAEVDHVRVFGARAKAARELAGLTQIEAAERLGFCNSSNISKIERAVNGGAARIYIPLSTIVGMASVYEVSADYLLGLTDDWEPEARLTERTIANFAYSAMEKLRRRDMQVIVEFEQKVRKIAIQSGELSNLVCSLWFAVRDLHEEQKKQGSVTDRMLTSLSLGQKAFAESTKCRRMLEKLRLHKKDHAAQLALTLISEPAVEDSEPDR